MYNLYFFYSLLTATILQQARMYNHTHILLLCLYRYIGSHICFIIIVVITILVFDFFVSFGNIL